MTMDRRTFLKTLAALGVSVSLPASLDNPCEVDAAWTATTKSWGLFEVNDYGTLSFANFEEPRTRRGIYGLAPADQLGVQDISRCQPLDSHVEQHFLDAIDELGLDPLQTEALAD